jgi:uncharacterized protein (DUF2267 family)
MAEATNKRQSAQSTLTAVIRAARTLVTPEVTPEVRAALVVLVTAASNAAGADLDTSLLAANLA